MNKKILLTLLVALILGATGMRAATNYGINVAGVEVSSSNYNNVTGSKITGSVTYDPTNKILTLTNATISRSDGGDDYGIHNRSVDELTIKIVGSCTVQCAKANALHLDKHTSISITSGSTLNAKMTAGENSGRGVIYVNDVTAYVTGSGTLNVTGTGKTSSYTIAGFEGKSKTGSSNVTLTNIKATINASGHGFYKCKSVRFGTQSDVKIHYSNGYALYETGAMYCNGTVKCVTPSEGTSFNSSSGYFLGGSTYSHFTDDWGVIVNSSNFPDGNFLGVMLGKCSSGEHYLTKSQHQNLTSLDCSSRSISSLTGINLLTYLTTLNCSYNNLTSLNVSSLTRLQTLRCNNNKLPYVYDLPASLQYLYCGGNQFTTWVVNNHSSLKTLDVSNTPTLTSLNCNNNALTSLTISGCTALNTISCDNNQFTSLPTLPSSLETLYCRGNKLTSLPTLPNSLKYLLCDGNNFTTLSLTGYTNLKQLDISNSTSLTKLNCYNNGLTTLNVSGCSALSTLSCYNNYLTTLGTLPSSLKTLYCYTNNLNTLNVSGCTSLTYLDCKANYLTSLGTLPNSLQTINCSNNRLSGTLSITGRSALKTLNVSSNTGLTTINCYGNALTSLNVDGCSALTTLNCYSNQLTSLGTLPNSLQTIDCSSNRLSGTLSVTGRSALKTLDASSNTSLTTLNCYGNALTSLNVIGCSSLTTLDCHSNQLTSFQVLSSMQTINCSYNRLSGTISVTSRSALKTLDVSYNTGLTTLNCYSNGLTSLNVDGCSSLTTLDCNSNQLTSLPSLPNSLQTLKCGNNRLSGTLSLTGRSALKTLDVSSNTDLNTLNCYSNALTSLSVVGCTALTTLNCYSNQLASLGTMPNSLQTINCSSNRLSGTLSITGHSALKTLDVSSNTGLTTLECYENALSSLNVSGCTSLTFLYCNNNQLTSLRVADCPALRHVACYGNQLAEDAMSRFVGDLPTIPTSEEVGSLLVLGSDNEGNVFTDSHKAAAAAKRWNAQMSDGSPIGGSGLRGDINGDGSVDVTDVNIIVNIILGKDNASNYPGNANIDGQGGIDVGDVNVIVNIILGKESDTPQPVTVTYDYMTEASLLAMGFADSELSPNISTFVYLESKQLSDQYATMDYRHFMLVNLSGSNYNLYFCSVDDAVLQDWDVTGGQLVLTPKNGKKITKVVVESFSANAASRVAISGNSSCTTATDGALTTATFSGSGAGTVTISGEKSVINKISVTYQ